MNSTNGNGDDLDIPDILKRTGGKEPATSIGVPMVQDETETAIPVPVEAPAPVRKPRKAVSKANGAAKAPVKAKAAPKAAKAAGKAVKAKATQKPKKRAAPMPVDAYGFRVGSMKSQAAAMYGSKKGATMDEVKAKIKSVQLNLLTDLQGKGFKVTKVKEDGDGKRQVTRYFLRTK